METKLDRNRKACLVLSFAFSGLILFGIVPLLVFFFSLSDVFGDGEIDPRKGLALLAVVSALGGLLALSGALLATKKWRHQGMLLGIPAHLLMALGALRISLYPILVFRRPYWGDSIPLAIALLSLGAGAYLLRLLLDRRPA